MIWFWQRPFPGELVRIHFVFCVGPTVKDLLFFWTAWALLPSAGEVLNIRVDGNKSTDLLRVTELNMLLRVSDTTIQEL